MFKPASFCEQCGAKLQEDAKFCIMCGAKLPDPIEMPELVEEPAPPEKPNIIETPSFISGEEDEYKPGTKVEVGPEPVIQEEPEYETVVHPDHSARLFTEGGKSAAKENRVLNETGEETVCLTAMDASKIPESAEQKFSRLAPIATLVRERSGEEITIDRPEFILGKNPNTTDYAVRGNNTVSRTHASITWSEEDDYKIVDLGSMNGTYVNGEGVGQEGKSIADGDLIELSDECFRLHLKEFE